MGKYYLLKRVKLLALDFDGVLTDNRVLVDENGREYVTCNRADGIGLANLEKMEIGVLVLSTETNPVVSQRCRKLGVDCLQGCSNKWKALREILKDKHISPTEVAYLGNDINDLRCLENVGFSICVADAHPEIKKVAHLVTKRKGGEGAVREVCDLFAKVNRRLMKESSKKDE